ncbi:MAG TPA: hypothetical protein VGL81_17025 [Polyangiaceae bacterium]
MEPQQTTVPADRTAHVKSGPAEIPTASVRFDTTTGSFVSWFVVPLPSCPSVSAPQQTTVPSERSAHVCSRPAEMARMPVMTLPGAVGDADVPLDESSPVRAPHAAIAVPSSHRGHERLARGSSLRRAPPA